MQSHSKQFTQIVHESWLSRDTKKSFENIVEATESVEMSRELRLCAALWISTKMFEKVFVPGGQIRFLVLNRITLSDLKEAEIVILKFINYNIKY